MKRLMIPSISLLLAVWLAACSAAPKEFKSETGGFSVMTPVALQKTTQEVETSQGGKLDLHLFYGQDGDLGYFVSYCDYDPQVAKPSLAENMLDGARDGAVSNVNGKLVSETNITLGDHPGREVIIEARAEDRPPAIIKSRMFMVKNRLYQVTTVASRGRAGDKALDDFLQSFKLQGQ